jgi:hypothetical protein
LHRIGAPAGGEKKELGGEAGKSARNGLIIGCPTGLDLADIAYSPKAGIRRLFTDRAPRGRRDIGEIEHISAYTLSTSFDPLAIADRKSLVSDIRFF